MPRPPCHEVPGGETPFVLWHRRIRTLAPLASLPQLICVASERRENTGYRCEGRYRKREKHFVFQYSLEGEGLFEDGHGAWRVPAGEGFLCEVGDPATAYGYPPGRRGPWTFVFVSFEDGYAAPLARELTARYGPVLPLPREHPALRRLLAFSAAPEAEVELSAPAGARLVTDLLLALSETRERRTAPDPDSELVRRARDLLDRRVRENPGVAAIAAELRVSREHLTRVFSRQTGSSPHRYLARRRVLLACRMLKDGGLAAKEIAARLGFRSPGQFSRAFRREIGLGPVEFREVGTVPAV